MPDKSSGVSRIGSKQQPSNKVGIALVVAAMITAFCLGVLIGSFAVRNTQDSHIDSQENSGM